MARKIVPVRSAPRMPMSGKPVFDRSCYQKKVSRRLASSSAADLSYPVRSFSLLRRESSGKTLLHSITDSLIAGWPVSMAVDGYVTSINERMSGSPMFKFAGEPVASNPIQLFDHELSILQLPPGTTVLYLQIRAAVWSKDHKKNRHRFERKYGRRRFDLYWCVPPGADPFVYVRGAHTVEQRQLLGILTVGAACGVM